MSKSVFFDCFPTTDHQLPGSCGVHWAYGSKIDSTAFLVSVSTRTVKTQGYPNRGLG